MEIVCDTGMNPMRSTSGLDWWTSPHSGLNFGG
jgi:hypothetical protein